MVKWLIEKLFGTKLPCEHQKVFLPKVGSRTTCRYCDRTYLRAKFVRKKEKELWKK